MTTERLPELTIVQRERDAWREKCRAKQVELADAAVAYANLKSELVALDQHWLRKFDAETEAHDGTLRAYDALLRSHTTATRQAMDAARHSMDAGHADQRRAESRAVRERLGFGPDSDDVAPADLIDAIERGLADAHAAGVREGIDHAAKALDELKRVARSNGNMTEAGAHEVGADYVRSLSPTPPAAAPRDALLSSGDRRDWDECDRLEADDE